MNATLVEFIYIISSIFFIYGLKMLGKAESARKGNFVSAIGMFIAIAVTLFHQGILSYEWILIGVIIGTIIGVVSAQRVQMTQMPEMVALFNGSGGLSSLLVGWAEYHHNPSLDIYTAVPIVLAVVIGGVTFSGSVVAYAKLAEKISGKPTLFAGQQIVNAVIVLSIVGGGVFWAIDPAGNINIFYGLMLVSVVFGVLSVIPIGGADMPVVISLLNSYSGMAASAAGFIIGNTVLIVAGSLVGASGIILTQIMCKAMNRSLGNVLFSGFGSGASASAAKSYSGEPKPINVSDTFLLLEAASSVVIVPGYGMAVAQAQHVVRELSELLQNNGAEVKFAIHPVAGRMPGHMNVLLAEANVDYDQLFVPEDVNPQMDLVDVAIVIGANDVVNPAARDDKTSPLFGMPIIEVDRARTCIVLKRGMSAGFAGVDNPLFFGGNTRMLFGDAKASISGLVSELKQF